MRRLSSPLVLCLVLTAIFLTLPTGNFSAQQQADSPFTVSRRLLEQGKFAEAIESLNTLAKSAPDLKGLARELGIAYYRKGDYDRARADWTKALQLAPNNASVKRNLEMLK